MHDARNEDSFVGPYREDEYKLAWQELRNSPLYKRAWVVQEVSLIEFQICFFYLLKQKCSVFCRLVYYTLRAINFFGSVMSFAPVSSFQGKCHVRCGPSVVSRIPKYLVLRDRCRR